MSKAPGVSVDIAVLSHIAGLIIYLGTSGFIVAGIFLSYSWFWGLLLFGPLFILQLYFRRIQKTHAVLRNFGVFGGLRYLMESIGPELRQYWIASDIEERPFTRRERGEVYQYSKSTLNTSSFGTLEDLKHGMIRHSLYPLAKNQTEPYRLTFGEERSLKSAYTISRPFMISAMSFGSLGEHAVRALARGARLSGIPINTGEGGYPKYHLMENPDVIFQIGTAKFGVRNDDSTLNDEKLSSLCDDNRIKMVEIKLSQGAKPGKGGMLPGEKVTEEIAELRGVPVGKSVYSPPGHVECTSPDSTVSFIRRVQEVSGLPTGVKLCIGNEDEFRELIRSMKKQESYPDFIVIDGAEGGTGAAPRSFLDFVGVPLFRALNIVTGIIADEKVADRFKLICSGKLINPARQIKVFANGADGVYTARGFMLAIGCIQALQCNTGTCPVGITTQNPDLQHGLDIEVKAQRVANYAENLEHGLLELLAATGCSSFRELREKNILFNPWEYN